MSGSPPKQRLEICPKCGGYMKPAASFRNNPGKRDWKDETYRRSFGGVEVKKFACEKCHHVQTFQVDDIGLLPEDE